MTTPGGPGSLNPNARFGITGSSAHGETVADLSQRLQAEMEDRLKADIKGSQGWKGASDAAFGGLMLRGTPGQPVSISLAIIASLAARLLGIDPQTWLISTDPHENIERILAELKKVPILDDLIELITGVEDGDESDLGTWALGIRNALQGIDLSNPGSILTAIGKAAAQFFKGVIPISWLADVIQDLIGGAGEFLNAESVTGNPYWSWDSVMPGFLSGGSIRATANGTQQVMRSEPFEVFQGQTLNLRAAAQWTGATATAGSNPVKVGFTPFDAAGNPLADVIRGTLQPSGDHGWQWVPASDKWPVPAGVAHVSELLILDSGATAGTFRFSNASAWASNLLDLGLVKDLREMVDAVGGVTNSEVANIEARLQAITADGKITASEIAGLIQQAQVSGLAIIQTIINQILDILNGNIVTPINSLVQGVKDWFGLNQNKTQALNGSGQIAGTAIVGSVSNGVVPGLQQLTDAINAGAQQAAGQAIGTVQDAIGLIFGSAQNAQQQASNNAAEIAAIKAAQTGAGNSGKSGGDQFGYTGTALKSPDWDTSLTGAGGVRTDGNNAYWNDSGGSAASEIDRFTLTTTNTDCFIASAVMANTMETPVLGSAECYNWILGRMSADRQNYVGMRLGYNSLSLWKVIGGAAPVQIGSSQAYTLGASERPALVCGVDVTHPLRFRMMVGDNPIGPDLDDSSGTLSLYGANYRQGGLRWDAAPRFGGQATPAKLAAFTIADWVQPTYVGSTARMIRASGTISSAVGTFILPNNAFNSLVYSTPDITPNLTDGSFTVSVKSNYLVKWSASATPSGSCFVLPGLYYTPAGGAASLWETGSPAGRISTGAGDVQPLPGGEVTSIIPMNPGDKVQCGYQSDNSGTTMAPRFSIVRMPTGV